MAFVQLPWSAGTAAGVLAKDEKTAEPRLAVPLSVLEQELDRTFGQIGFTLRVARRDMSGNLSARIRQQKIETADL